MEQDQSQPVVQIQAQGSAKSMERDQSQPVVQIQAQGSAKSMEQVMRDLQQKVAMLEAIKHGLEAKLNECNRELKDANENLWLIQKLNSPD